jgi:quercetin dioxygenase-like cupin family protein
VLPDAVIAALRAADLGFRVYFFWRAGGFAVRATAAGVREELCSMEDLRMKRRAFLKTAAAAFPAAGLGGFAFGQAASTAAVGGVHPVGAGEDRLGETHSLGFSTILFKVETSETSGGLFVIEHKGLGHGGPPVHIHLKQDEWFYVMEGEVLFQLGSERRTLRAGESVLGPRGIPHGFAGVGEKPAHMLIAFTPAGKMEAFFRETAVPNGPKMDAPLMARYDMQYVGPPLVA